MSDEPDYDSYLSSKVQAEVERLRARVAELEAEKTDWRECAVFHDKRNTESRARVKELEAALRYAEEHYEGARSVLYKIQAALAAKGGGA